MPLFFSMTVPSSPSCSAVCWCAALVTVAEREPVCGLSNMPNANIWVRIRSTAPLTVAWLSVPAVRAGCEGGRIGERHRDVHAGLHRRDAGIVGAPVGGDEAAVVRLLVQPVLLHVGVLAGGVAVDHGVGAHHRGRRGLLGGGLEGRQVELFQCLLADRLVVVAVGVLLLVVGGDVLDHGHHALALQALDLGRGDLAGQVRVLAVGLVGAAPARVAHQVGRRAEGDVHALARELGAHRRALLLDQRRVPGRGRVLAVGEGGHAAGPVTDPVRAVLQVGRRGCTDRGSRGSGRCRTSRRRRPPGPVLRPGPWC